MHYDIVALPKEQWKGTSPCRAGKTLYADARMLQARETISGTIKAYMESEGYAFSPASRIHHSLDALHFTYTNAAGNQDKRKKYYARQNYFQRC